MVHLLMTSFYIVAKYLQNLAGGLSPSTPIRIQLPGSNFTLTVPGLLASHLATSQGFTANHQPSSQESSDSVTQEDSSQDSSGIHFIILLVMVMLEI